MNCAEARLALLQAEIEELREERDSPLARHLGECPRCREMAQAIVRDEVLLAGALADSVHLPAPEQILDRALGGLTEPGAAEGAAGGEERALPPPPGLIRTRPSILRRSLPWVPVAAAAALAALLLGRVPSPPGPTPTLPPPSTGLQVEAPPGQNVAVLETADPNITVVWLF